MSSINTKTDFSTLFGGVLDADSSTSTIIPKKERKKKGKTRRESKTKRYPLNVRVNEDLRLAFISVCKKDNVPQYKYLEEAMKKVVKKYGKS